MGLGTELRGWDPVCFRGHRETREFQDWEPDCFRENGGLGGLRGWDPDWFRGNRELGELRNWDPDFFRGNGELDSGAGVENLELAAVKLALEEWRHWQEGAKVPFIVWTDHRNLEYIYSICQGTEFQTGPMVTGL